MASISPTNRSTSAIVQGAVPHDSPQERIPGFRLHSRIGKTDRLAAPALSLGPDDHHSVWQLEPYHVESVATIGGPNARYNHQEDASLCGLRSPNTPQATVTALQNAFRAAHEATRTHGSGAVCTVGVLAPDNTLTIAHLGDAPALLFILNIARHQAAIAARRPAPARPGAARSRLSPRASCPRRRPRSRPWRW